MADDDPPIEIRPALRPRLEFLLTAAFMLGVAAVCVAMALTRGRAILDPTSGIELGGLEPFKHILVALVWIVAGVALLLALYSLWAVAAASRRLHLRIADGVLEWRPYLGRRVRVDLATVRAVEDRPRRGLVGPHLAVSWGRRRAPLRLLRKWYLPLDIKRLRGELRRHLPADDAPAT